MGEDNDHQQQDGSDGAIVENSFTCIGRSMAFRGRLTSAGTVRVDGRLEGEIYTKGTIEVGETGVLQGIIHTGTLISNGTINGTITATGKVHLLKTSILIGEIHTPLLSIEEGAHLQGLCNKGACSCTEQESQNRGLGLAAPQAPRQATIEHGNGHADKEQLAVLHRPVDLGAAIMKMVCQSVRRRTDARART